MDLPGVSNYLYKFVLLPVVGIDVCSKSNICGGNNLEQPAVIVIVMFLDSMYSLFKFLADLGRNIE